MSANAASSNVNAGGSGGGAEMPTSTSSMNDHDPGEGTSSSQQPELRFSFREQSREAFSKKMKSMAAESERMDVLLKEEDAKVNSTRHLTKGHVGKIHDYRESRPRHRKESKAREKARKKREAAAKSRSPAAALAPPAGLMKRGRGRPRKYPLIVAPPPLLEPSSEPEEEDEEPKISAVPARKRAKRVVSPIPALAIPSCRTASELARQKKGFADLEAMDVANEEDSEEEVNFRVKVTLLWFTSGRCRDSFCARFTHTLTLGLPFLLRKKSNVREELQKRGLCSKEP